MVSDTLLLQDKDRQVGCLNPCFSGRWSLTNDACQAYKTQNTVLILVLVEDGL